MNYSSNGIFIKLVAIRSLILIALHFFTFTHQVLAVKAIVPEESSHTSAKTYPLEKVDCAEMHQVVLDSKSDVTNCSNPNGKLAIRLVSGSLNTSYSIVWYNNDRDVVGRNSQASNLSVGFYTVEVTYLPTGCKSIDVFEVTFFPFEITEYKITPNTNSTEPNGIFEIVRIGENVVGVDLEMYEITLFDPKMNLIAVNHGAFIRNLPEGIYRVISKHKSFDCESYLNIEIYYENKALDFHFEIKPNSSCDPLQDNGSLGLVLPEPSFSYEISWFSNSDGVLLGDKTFISNLSSGSYSVDVRHIESNSSRSATATIADLQKIPIVLAQVDQLPKGCDLSSGVVSAQVYGQTEDYIFNWYNGDQVKNTIDFIGAVYSGLKYGNYVVTATEVQTGCTSAPFVVSLAGAEENCEEEIAITAVIFDGSTSCINPNGAASIESISKDGVLDQMTNYAYSWFDHDLNYKESHSAIVGLAPGTYYVSVTSKVSGQQSELVQFIIDDLSVLPAIVLESKTDNSNCLHPNGALTITLQNGVLNEVYTINWFKNGQLLNSSFNHISNLDEGIYAVEVKNLMTGCQSSNSYVIETLTPQIMGMIITNNTSSKSANGQIEIASIFDNNVEWNLSGFKFFLFDGESEVSSDIPYFSKLSEGDYFIYAQNMTTGCKTLSLAVSIKDEIEDFEISFNSVPNTSCDPSKYNGSLSVNLPGSDYEVSWYNGAGESLGDQNEISHLSAGEYTVWVTQKVTSNTRTATAVVEEMQTIPAVSAKTEQKPIACQPFSGILSAHVAGQTEGYIFSWYEGEQIKSNADFTGIVYDGLTYGKYTVTATEVVIGCTSAPLMIELKAGENAMPPIELNDIKVICSETPSIILSGGFPEGGTYSGEGVVGNRFIPSKLPIGTHQVTYSYIDEEGCSYSITKNMEITECKELSEAIMFPNPSKGQFFFEFNKKQAGSLEIKVVNSKGETVIDFQRKLKDGPQQLGVELSGNAPGIYMVILKDDTSVRTHRVVLNP